MTVVKGDLKAPFLIATTPCCRGGCYSFLWIAPLPLIHILCWVLSKEALSTIFWVFGMTQPGIEKHSNHHANVQLCVCVCVCVYIYIYIYIFIDFHPQTDCYVVSQLFSVARYAGHFKLGSKPTHLNIRLSILPLSQQTTNVISGIITHT